MPQSRGYFGIIGIFNASENARRISFEKIPAIPAQLRICRVHAYTSIAFRAAHPHLTPDLPDFFESLAGREMRRADHLAPRRPFGAILTRWDGL
jgi:hypothetical protein